MELLSGAEMVVRFLRDEGVKYIYGYPGGALLHIYDALFKEKEVTHILVRHEQAATIRKSQAPPFCAGSQLKQLQAQQQT